MDLNNIDKINGIKEVYFIQELLRVIYKLECRANLDDLDTQAPEHWKPTVVIGEEEVDLYHIGYDYDKKGNSCKKRTDIKGADVIINHIENMKTTLNSKGENYKDIWFSKEETNDSVIITRFDPINKTYEKVLITNYKNLLDKLKIKIQYDLYDSRQNSYYINHFLDKEKLYSNKIYEISSEFKIIMNEFKRDNSLEFIDKDLINIVNHYNLTPIKSTPQRVKKYIEYKKLEVI